ncbi:unnamed protein product [Polarella glacialis]|uniref:Uncharacterized protein n=1 Tax=Polarella glacialis TaxID=89957 RepID=A0A813GCP9_POLGL|nr:unnamed protein product [Polarella glacialis]
MAARRLISDVMSRSAWRSEWRRSSSENLHLQPDLQERRVLSPARARPGTVSPSSAPRVARFGLSETGKADSAGAESPGLLFQRMRSRGDLAPAGQLPRQTHSASPEQVANIKMAGGSASLEARRALLISKGTMGLQRTMEKLAEEQRTKHESEVVKRTSRSLVDVPGRLVADFQGNRSLSFAQGINLLKREGVFDVDEVQEEGHENRLWAQDGSQELVRAELQAWRDDNIQADGVSEAVLVPSESKGQISSSSSGSEVVPPPAPKRGVAHKMTIAAVLQGSASAWKRMSASGGAKPVPDVDTIMAGSKSKHATGSQRTLVTPEPGANEETSEAGELLAAPDWVDNWLSEGNRPDIVDILAPPGKAVHDSLIKMSETIAPSVAEALFANMKQSEDSDDMDQSGSWIGSESSGSPRPTQSISQHRGQMGPHQPYEIYDPRSGQMRSHDPESEPRHVSKTRPGKPKAEEYYAQTGLGRFMASGASHKKARRKNNSPEKGKRDEIPAYMDKRVNVEIDDSEGAEVTAGRSMTGDGEEAHQDDGRQKKERKTRFGRHGGQATKDLVDSPKGKGKIWTTRDRLLTYGPSSPRIAGDERALQTQEAPKQPPERDQSKDHVPVGFLANSLLHHFGNGAEAPQVGGHSLAASLNVSFRSGNGAEAPQVGGHSLAASLNASFRSGTGAEAPQAGHSLAASKPEPAGNPSGPARSGALASGNSDLMKGSFCGGQKIEGGQLRSGPSAAPFSSQDSTATVTTTMMASTWQVAGPAGSESRSPRAAVTLSPAPLPPIVDVRQHGPGDITAHKAAQLGQKVTLSASQIQAVRELSVSGEWGSATSRRTAAAISAMNDRLSSMPLAQEDLTRGLRTPRDPGQRKPFTARGPGAGGVETAMVLPGGAVLGSPGGWAQSLGSEVGEHSPVSVGNVLTTWPKEASRTTSTFGIAPPRSARDIMAVSIFPFRLSSSQYETV